MGERFLQVFREKVKTEQISTFWITFGFSLLIHLYKFSNTLPNHDSLYNYYSDQNVLGSGRWALSLACGISSYYDLPWVIGLLSCLFIALTAVVIVTLFDIRNPVLIGLSGALLAAAPATTETLFFLFTADGYMVAMLLAALGVWFSRIDENRVSRLILSGVCICISCGIYQAYVSFALVLAICHFIIVLLEGSHNKEVCFKWILHQVVIFITALVVFYVIWKLCMHISGITANDYQGISEVGKITPALLVGGLVRSVKSVIFYFLQWNVLEHGFSLYSILSILFLFVLAVGIAISMHKSRILHRKWALVLLVLCLAALIPFSCIWHFTSDSIGYRPMMLQCLTLLFILAGLLYEKWAKPNLKDIVCLFLIVTVFNNAIIANICYFYLNLSYERTYAEGLEMMTEIHNLQDAYEFDKIAIIGSRLSDVQWEREAQNLSETSPAESTHMLSSLIETSLLFDQIHTVRFLQYTFGMSLTPVTNTEYDLLCQTQTVQDMGCWPVGDSVIVLGDTLIIKLAETVE